MDMIYVYIGAGAVVLIVGIIFAVRGVKAAAEERDIVPLSDLNEVKDIYASDPSKGLSLNLKDKDAKASGFSLTKHMIDENVKKTTAQAGTSGAGAASGEEFAQKIENLEKENLRLSQALERELSSKNRILADKDLLSEMNFKDEQILKSQTAVENLTKENQKMMKMVEEQRTAVAEMEKAHADYKAELEKNRKGNAAQLEQLEEKFNKLQQEKEQIFKDNETLRMIEERNKQAQEDYAQKERQWTNMSQEVTTLKDRAQSYQDQLKEKERDLQALEQRIEQITKEDDAKFKEAGQTIERLEEQVKQADQLKNQQLQRELNDLTARVEEMRRENDRLLKLIEEDKSSYDRMKDQNAYLLAKERKLSYELTKSRAQAMGLEKICEDFKVQIEDLSVS